MAKYRIWAECISDVYIDIEANIREEAEEYAAELDGGDFHEDYMGGEWRMCYGSTMELDDDADVDYVVGEEED